MNAFFETTNGFNFQIIDPLIESRGVRLTWFDCKYFTLIYLSYTPSYGYCHDIQRYYNFLFLPSNTRYMRSVVLQHRRPKLKLWVVVIILRKSGHGEI